MSTALFTEPIYINTSQSAPYNNAPENFNGLTVVVPTELSEAEREQLNKIIELALQLQPEACWLIAANGKLPLSLLQSKGTTRVLLFGTHQVLPARNLKWRKNAAVSLLGMRILITDALSVLMDNAEAKKTFWNGCRASFLGN